MACFSLRNAASNYLFNNKKCSIWSRRRHDLSLRCVTGGSTSLVLQIAKMLGPAASFQASNLKVVFIGEEAHLQRRLLPRIYTLTHCDFTGNLTLAVSHSVNVDQLTAWYHKVWMDDVIGEWKKGRDHDMSLHVHCHVLQAVIHGDSGLFHERPEFIDSIVWVHFHSNARKYNRLECWGPLKDAAQPSMQTKSSILAPKNGSIPCPR